MTTMTYKGYTAEVAIDPIVEVFAERVLCLRDLIYFAGETVGDAEQKFHLSIDDYLA